MTRNSAVYLALLLLAACGPAGDGPATPVAEAATTEVDVLELPDSIGDLGIINARAPAPSLLTGGQPTEDQFAALKELGYSTFVTLRLADEPGTGWEEAYTESAGIDFVRIPVAGAEGITPENAERLAEVLDIAGEEPVFVYCGSGNRVGALLALKAHTLDGWSAEDAIEFGLAAGLTRLEPVVRDQLGLYTTEE